MTFTGLFINRHGEVRVGWRLTLSVVLTGTLIRLCRELLIALKWGDDFVVNAFVLASSLLTTFLMVRFINKKPFGAVGFSLHPRMFRELGMGCLLGFLMMTGIFLVELLGGYAQLSWRGLTAEQTARTLLWSIPYFGVAASLEETLFRGYFFQTLIQLMTFLPATLVMSLFFAVGHALNPHATVFGLINVALAGIWFSVAYMKTRSLWLPCGLHFAWNFSQTSLYAFPTSGIGFGGLRIFDLVQRGPEWLTGGPFGPEGGALATLALVVGTWYVLKSPYLRAPGGIVTLDSVEDLLPPSSTEEGETA